MDGIYDKVMEKESLDLFEFQTKLKKGIEGLFPEKTWLRAEISAIKARSGSHCYLELSQSDSKGLVAKASAVIWASKFRLLSPYFESVTGESLGEGMKVLIEVQVNYSQLYGFTLVVSDIDPEYTIGEKERQRQLTIERLKKEGLLELQKEFKLPSLPERFAVISAEDAAGYRDFVRHLEANPYGFYFDFQLYPALMQGALCPESIIAALDEILASGLSYDAVLILRGGGSKLDLACYDDYDLASVIAQYPLPILTAIGHDQDYHICDMVAHLHLKTPTALAGELISMYESEDAMLTSYRDRVLIAAKSKIQSFESHILLLKSRLRNAFIYKISAMESKVELLMTRIAGADPRAILKRGYVLALDDKGVVMKAAGNRRVGERLSMMFHDGVLECKVENVRIK